MFSVHQTVSCCGALAHAGGMCTEGWSAQGDGVEDTKTRVDYQSRMTGHWADKESKNMGYSLILCRVESQRQMRWQRSVYDGVDWVPWVNVASFKLREGCNWRPGAIQRPTQRMKNA